MKTYVPCQVCGRNYEARKNDKWHVFTGPDPMSPKGFNMGDVWHLCGRCHGRIALVLAIMRETRSPSEIWNFFGVRKKKEQ